MAELAIARTVGFVFLVVFYAVAVAAMTVALWRPRLSADWCFSCEKPAAWCECGLFAGRAESC